MIKNMDFSLKNKRLEARRTQISIVVELLLIVFLAIICVPNVSSLEFDNIKTYDPITKEVTIENAFGLPNYLRGYEIAKVKLDSPLNVEVGLGYQKVFEYTIESFVSYEDFIKQLEVYNLKDNSKVNKQIDLKYLTYEDVEVIEYKTICDYKIEYNPSKNSFPCQEVEVGKHTEQKQVWNDLAKMDVKIEKITISGWTEVSQGDYYEWIPNFAGVKVNEWATWAGNLSVGILSYWKADNSYADELGANNGSGSGITNVSGKLIYGWGMNGVNSAINVGSNTIDLADGNFTMNLWAYFQNVGAGNWGNILCAEATNAYCWGLTDAGLINFGKYGVDIKYSVGAVTKGQWTMITLVYDTSANVLKYYFNGTYSDEDSYSSTFGTGTYYIGTQSENKRFNGTIDDFGVWTRVLSDSEIAILYNSGTGCQYGDETCYALPTPTIILNSPADAYNSATNSLTFNASVTSATGVSNVSLYLNGILNQTNTSGFNVTNYIFTKTLAEGDGNWTIGSCNLDGCTLPTARTFTIDTTVPVLSGVALNTSTVYTVGDKVKLNLTATDLHLDKCWYNYNGANTTITGCLTGVQNQTDITTVAGQTTIRVWANDTFGLTSLPSTVNFAYDTSVPQFTINYPTAMIDYEVNNSTLTLNFSATDVNLDKCWYNYNGTNVTVTGCLTGVSNVSNITLSTKKNITFYANDTAGNSNSTFLAWNYRLFETGQSYTASVLEGVSNSFGLNLTTNGTAVSLVYLNYNGTNYVASISESGNNYVITRSLTAPQVSADSNLTFYWNISMADGFYYTPTSSNQTVSSFSVDNCSVNTVVLYNFTMKDEGLQTELNESAVNTEARVSLQLRGYGTSTELLDYNTLFNQTNPFAICINDTLTTERYNLDAQIEYKAVGYETEFYNIQNETITVADFPTNISLYDLNTSNSQVFKIIFKDSSFLAVPDALIYVYRKYIDEGVFKVVELPKTDSDGETITHLVVNDVIYNFVVVKNGVTLGTFSNVRAVCQNPTITTCTIDFNAYGDSITVPDYEVTEDFNYTLAYNRTTRTVTSQFTIPSENPSNITLEVIREDQLGVVYCTDSVTSTSGTLTCVVPNSFGNATAFVKLYKNSVFQSYGQINMAQTATDIYGGAQIVLAIFVFLTLIGVGLSDNPVYTAIFMFIGVLLLFAMRIIEGGGFVGSAAIILFFLVAVVIIVIKGGRRS